MWLKIHVDDHIRWHIVGCSELVTNQFIVKLCSFQKFFIHYLSLKSVNKSELNLIAWEFKLRPWEMHFDPKFSWIYSMIYIEHNFQTFLAPNLKLIRHSFLNFPIKFYTHFFLPKIKSKTKNQICYYLFIDWILGIE